MRKKMLRSLSLLIVASLGALILAGCAVGNNGGGGGGGGGGQDGDDILIGVLTPTTGSEAYYGNDMNQSYELAVKEINDAGGVLGRQLKLYPADDGCNPNMASQAATKITSQNVDFVVGGYCSGATIPALQTFYDKDLIMLISAANSTDITALGLDLVFMLNSPGTHALL
ncbi:MAG: ABC transporter substrate-binding protein, partial [Oscillospiraceae bacterium]|nr:ABC transporter substrate-binding protein [Oscillospiraceae bacterium]